MTVSRLASAAALILIAATACVRRETTVEVTPDEMGATDVRGATNLPPQFVVVAPAATPADCPPRLRDPGLGAALQLQRSVLRPVSDSAGVYRPVGDYAVEPRGLYGEKPGEGIRVDCARLRAIGIIRL